MGDKPKYNPQIHHRRSIRLKGYDYSQAGLYFITICCKDRECCFGKIEDNEMVLNEYGTIAYNEWIKLPERFANFELEVFQIMPNHMHGIIALTHTTTVGAGFTSAQNDDKSFIAQNDDKSFAAQNDDESFIAQNDDKSICAQNDDKTFVAQNDRTGNNQGAGVNPAPTNAAVGDIVGAYKSLVANACLKIFKSRNETMGKIWQRNYYEHIIRNEQSYQTISNYIINNPANWKGDKFYK